MNEDDSLVLWRCEKGEKNTEERRAYERGLVQARGRGLHNTELVLDFRKSGNSTRGHESKSRINV